MLKTFGIMFVATFFICLFIFIMQFMWLYVDDMVGKGLSLDVLARFFWFATLTLVPRSLPLAVLLASLMTFGNLGERVELTAMKSAGIPLIRVMAPLMVFCIALCGASFYFQNVVIPHAQLQLQTLIISMKQKSPELEIPEGAFYDGISSYNLYVKQKNPETGTLYGVVIYNMSDGAENAVILKADSGRLETTADKQFLRMTLWHGEQFENLKTDQISKKNIPYRREVFGKKTMLIAFNDDFSLMDSGFLSANASNKNMAQLAHDVDSLEQEQDSIGRVYFNQLKDNTYAVYKPSKQDSTVLSSMKATSINVDSVYYTATRDKQQNWRNQEKTKLENMKTETALKTKTVYLADKNIRKHRIERLNKITLSLGCLVFFFIGAPLGAIIRKGGLGLPVVISVFIFIIYYILDTSGAKLAREGEMTIWFGRWLSTLVLAPMGAFFTYKANNDSTVFNLDMYKNALRWLAAIPDERHVMSKEVIIDDPDYAEIDKSLDLLSKRCETWIDAHDLQRTSYRDMFFGKGGADVELSDIRSQVEEIVNELGNSRDVMVLDHINQYPLFSDTDHLTPIRKKWMNIAAGILIPIGGLLWLRAEFFRRRRLKNMLKIEEVSGLLQQDFVNRKLKQK
ncbi:MAG: LptF/LptG family permease [Bacteroidaceae bacterium]|nr:LptF/LptG family permease [Bacteroidaceae bacterium]